MGSETKEVKYALKDSVFTLLFSEISNVRKLYQELHDDGENYSDEDFKIITLENAFINGLYNDLGFSVKDRLIILVEAQSTFNPNMGVRFLMYIAKSYHDYIVDNKLNIFGEKLIKLPAPEFIVVYSGSKKTDIDEIRLSDCFPAYIDPNIELKVKVIRSDTSPNGILQEYLSFCELYTANTVGKQNSEEKLESLRSTINECIHRGILTDFLKKHQKEVEAMLMTVLSPEQAIEFIKYEEYNKGIQEGEAKGIVIGEARGEAKGIAIGETRGIAIGEAKGATAKALRIAQEMKSKGFSLNLIAEITGLSEDKIEGL